MEEEEEEERRKRAGHGVKNGGGSLENREGEGGEGDELHFIAENSRGIGEEESRGEVALGITGLEDPVLEERE